MGQVKEMEKVEKEMTKDKDKVKVKDSIGEYEFGTNVGCNNLILSFSKLVLSNLFEVNFFEN